MTADRTEREIKDIPDQSRHLARPLAHLNDTLIVSGGKNTQTPVTGNTAATATSRDTLATGVVGDAWCQRQRRGQSVEAIFNARAKLCNICADLLIA